MSQSSDRILLTQMFDAAIEAADPEKSLLPFLPPHPKGRTVVVGAGKGSAQMASALEQIWGGQLEGVVVTRYGYRAPTKYIKVFEASHPVPDRAGLKATSALFDAVAGLTENDLVIALVCGGGSALLPAPPIGLDFEDEVALNQLLLKSGAPISVMNAIRKQFSRVKGGRLAKAAFPAPVVTFVVSDVPGDDPAQVASGPTVPDTSDREKALAFIKGHGIDLPERLQKYLETTLDDSPHPSDAEFMRNKVRVVASAGISLTAAAHVAHQAGVQSVILSDEIEGEARDIGMMHAAIARRTCLNNTPFKKPVVILSGGETTVSIQDFAGRGGRNTEFLLALAGGVENLKLTALAADTDGIDGSESNAGAFADGRTWDRLRQLGHDPRTFLANHDAWSAFDALGDLFSPGPTGTNVNDFRAILIR
ncbi:MAG: glycerate kinase [Pseudomonadota bacterium]